MGTALSSLLPVASIIVLYFITSVLVRMIIIGVFTAGFSVSLKSVINADWWMYPQLLQRKSRPLNDTSKMTDVFGKFHRCPIRFGGNEWECE